MSISSKSPLVQNVLTAKCKLKPDCADPRYDPAGSNTWTVSFTLLKADESNAETQVNVIVYPQFPEDTLTLTSRLGTDIVLDSRGQDQVKYPVSAVDQVESGRDGQGGGSGQAVRLGAGVSGFFGLGINQVSDRKNPLTSAKQATVHRCQYAERGQLSSQSASHQ